MGIPGTEYTCSDCGSAVSERATACPKCGVSFENPADEEPAVDTASRADSMPHCARCGGVVDQGNSLCQECIEVLAETGETPTGGEDDDVSYHLGDPHHAAESVEGRILIVCPSCGARLHREAASCPQCGVDFDPDLAPIPTTDGKVSGDDADPVRESSPVQQPFHSTLPLARQISWVLTIAIVLNIVAIVSSFVHLENIPAAYAGDPLARKTTLLSSHRILQISQVQLSLYFVVYVLFLAFVHQACVDLAAMRVGGLKNSPGSAVVKLLLPPANILYAYSLAREIWRGSDPSSPGTSSVRGFSSAPIVTGWWASGAAFLVTAVYASILFKTAETGAEARMLAWVLIGANALAVCTSVLTRKITTQVTHRLEQKKNLILSTDGASLVESKVTQQEMMIPIPLGGWVFYRILKTLETTTDETLSLKRRIKGFLWLFGGMVAALVAYLSENTALGLVATFSIIYAIMLIISGTIGRLDSDGR